MSSEQSRKKILLIYLFLTLTTLAVFWRINQCDFVSYDDPPYVTENTHVLQGFTWDAIRWAFTTGHTGNWHPVTWLSHMADVQLFGLNPRGHHLINLLFHIANTLLLFFVFHRMTKAPWKSAFAAALFAIHPLHVESVAWVAERKDVLSTFFWMLTIAAYVHYADQRRLHTYLAVLIFFVLGLMSKPMLVTLPFVLLLLDYWPLGRFEGLGAVSLESQAGREDRKTGLKRAQIPANKRKGKAGKNVPEKGVASSSTPPSCADQGQDHRPQPSVLYPLLLEKIPLFVIAAISCMVTYIVQQKGGAVSSLEAFSLGVRFSNAIVAYVIYAEKTVWPLDLAVLYPHPGLRPLWQVAGAVVLFGALTFTVIRGAKKFPYLAFGWLWFAGTLVPVIGIVQVGVQAMADRYTYVPLIGLFVMVAWGIPELVKKWPFGEKALLASSALIFPCLFTATWIQVGYWIDSMSLYNHTLQVAATNHIILNNRGAVYYGMGDPAHAISDYDHAIEIDPQYSDAYFNRGVAYDRIGNQRRAISDFARAIEIKPDYVRAYNRRGIIYGELGDRRLAISDFDRAIELNPEYAEAYLNRGVAYSQLENKKRAIEDFDKAVEIDLNYADAYFNRGATYAELGDFRQAIFDYDKAINIHPNYADAYNNRGLAYSKLGDWTRATEDLQKAARLNSESAQNFLRRIGISW